MTPADLVAEKWCTAACMIASTRHHRCRCMCLGRFHGLLLTADVTTLITARQIQPADISTLPSRRWSA